MLTSYNASFATLWGRKVRDLISQNGNKFGIILRPDVRAANNFQLITGGSMITIGAGGSLTGRGADLLIVDDPIKNDTEANSKNHRDSIWDWFNSTAFTRVEPGGTVIIVMTRWHCDDICGRIITRQNTKIITNNSNNNHNNDWIIINFPAIAETNDILGRKSGEALWSERYDINKLIDIKNQIGEYWFAALYQQRPVTADGNIFKRKYFKYFIEDNIYYYLPENEFDYSIDITNANQQKEPDTKISAKRTILKTDCSIFAVMDLAATTKQTSDFTAIIIFAISQNKEILILDIIKEKFEGSEHLNLLKQVYLRWKPTLIGIESVQYQISLIQIARKLNLPVRPLKADKDKVSRSLPIATLMEAGKVYFKEDAHWLNNFEEELLSFPNGKHDDQVDAFAYISTMLEPVIQAKKGFKYFISETNRLL
jgi:predicted phage terminase large subunit-like protein